jgi:hypothetical protein
VQTFDFIDGVWVTDPKCAIAVAVALRESLLALSAARLAGEGQQTKMRNVVRRGVSGHEGCPPCRPTTPANGATDALALA